VFDYAAITGNPGMGVATPPRNSRASAPSPTPSFDRRQGNSVQYWSPDGRVHALA
jgi:hypothetical protein